MTASRRQPRRPAPAGVIRLAFAAIIALALAAFLVGRAQRSSAVLHGAALNPPRPAVGFTLQGPDNEDYDLYQFRGRQVLLTFSYTTCLEGCDDMLTRLADAQALLGEEAYLTQVIVVTIDPDHDSADMLNEYIHQFDDSFLGLTGPPHVVRDLANSYDSSFARRDLDGGRYQIEHTPLAILIDRFGWWRAVYPLSMAAKDIAADLETLQQEAFTSPNQSY